MNYSNDSLPPSSRRAGGASRRPRLAIGFLFLAAIAACHDAITPVPTAPPPRSVVFVTVEADRQRFEPGDTEVLRVIVADSAGTPLEGRTITWTSSDTSVATVTSAGVVTAREAGLFSVAATSEGRSGSLRLAVSDPPSARLLYQRTVPDTNGIFVIANTPGSVPARVWAPQLSRHPAASPDGSRIAFAASMIAPTGETIDDIFLVDRDGTNLRRLTNDEGSDDMPAWSPNPAMPFLAFVHRDAWTLRDDIWVIAIDGTDARNLTADLPTGTTLGEPAWSPDGQWIAFSQSRRDGSAPGGIWIMRIDGSGKRRVTSNAEGGFDVSPSWSPDGLRIVFARNGLAIVQLASGQVERILLPGFATAPSWSPDGRHIAFAWQSAAPGLGAWDIYTVHPDGSDMRRRASDVARFGHSVTPRWIGELP